MSVSDNEKSFGILPPGANVIKHFTAAKSFITLAPVIIKLYVFVTDDEARVFPA